MNLYLLQLVAIVLKNVEKPPIQFEYINVVGKIQCDETVFHKIRGSINVGTPSFSSV